MAQQSNDAAIELFKTCYGKMHDLVPQDQQLSKDIPWEDGCRVGDTFKEDVILGDEVGITFGGSAQDAFEINPAIAGAVKQTSVSPYMSVLPSILPYGTISRSLGDKQAFMAATKFITKNNLKSHERLQEIARWYGQSTKGLGHVSYYSGTYRGASFTTGTGTVNSVSFTNGINSASKLILLQKGEFAAGHWVGKKGIKVKQVTVSDGSVAAAGKLVSVNAKYGYLEVDFTPVAASSATSHKLVLDGWESTGEMVGIHSILTTAGTLFGINNSTFELFKGNEFDCENKKLSLNLLQDGLADAVNGAGLEGEVCAYVNPKSWATLSNTEAGLRVYDKSYSENSAKNGFMDIEYYTQTGKITIKAHRCVMEGDAFVLKKDVWKRSGSAQVGFKVPGMSQDLIKEMENQAGFQFKSFSDQYIFTPEPAQNILFKNIDHESAS